ncbi:MAG: co-chaperone GroES [Planctomycetes bacterium]|nr:co-chaperone GroES [Planctomycetota bacterium]
MATKNKAETKSEHRTEGKTRLRPLNDKIVIKRLEAEEKTKGGIVLPDTAKEKPREGRVVSLGDGKLLESGERAAFQVKENDRVLFSSYSGTEVKIDGQEFLIVNEDDILAVLA